MSLGRARIVGAGVYSGAGRGVEAFWRALCAAEPGQAEHNLGDTRLLARPYVAVPDEHRGGEDDTATSYLRGACEDALASAARTLQKLPARRTALFGGSSLGGMSVLEHQQRQRWGHCATAGAGLWAPELPGWRGLYDGPVRAVGVAQKLSAGAWAVNTACSSAANALGLARLWLHKRRIDVALVAGFDVVSPFVYAGFACLGALDGAPSSPFGAERRGLNLGEAAVALVLVRSEEADAPAVDICGYGSSCDAHHLTRPDLGGAGLARAIGAALGDAGLAPADIAALSAHGTGTPYNDAMEAAAYRTVFGAAMPPVHCAKPVFGHTLGAAGAVDALSMALALEHGELPGTFRRGAEDDRLAVHPSAIALPLAKEAFVMSTSSGFGGSNAALVFVGPGAQ